jgi:hypothetical protein
VGSTTGTALLTVAEVFGLSQPAMAKDATTASAALKRRFFIEEAWYARLI